MRRGGDFLSFSFFYCVFIIGFGLDIGLGLGMGWVGWIRCIILLLYIVSRN